MDLCRCGIANKPIIQLHLRYSVAIIRLIFPASKIPKKHTFDKLEKIVKSPIICESN